MQIGLVLNFRTLLHEALGEAVESRAPFVHQMARTVGAHGCLSSCRRATMLPTRKGARCNAATRIVAMSHASAEYSEPAWSLKSPRGYDPVAFCRARGLVGRSCAGVGAVLQSACARRR